MDEHKKTRVETSAIPNGLVLYSFYICKLQFAIWSTLLFSLDCFCSLLRIVQLIIIIVACCNDSNNDRLLLSSQVAVCKRTFK